MEKENKLTTKQETKENFELKDEDLSTITASCRNPGSKTEEPTTLTKTEQILSSYDKRYTYTIDFPD